MIIEITEHLKIELVPSKEADGEPLLILSATEMGDQRIILFLNEALLLKDALAEAAVLLAEMEVQEPKMTAIEEMIAKEIREGGELKIVEQDGVRGVIFFAEPWEFLPFKDLGYDQTLGYYKLSLFPDVTDECASSA